MPTYGFTISKAAASLVKAGKAVFSSGGVRSITGELIELAKPVISSGANAFLSGGGGTFGTTAAVVNMVSSVGSNVQCALIQKGVNLANIKLDSVIKGISALSNSLGCVQALSWVTSAFSLANVGLSVAGFYKTLKKLDDVSGQLKVFYDRYCSDRQDDEVYEFSKIIGRMKSDLYILQSRNINDSFGDEYFCSNEQIIRRDIVDAIAFLRKILKEFQQDKINGEVALQIIFTLASILCDVSNNFSCQYFYVHSTEDSILCETKATVLELSETKYRDFIYDYISFSPEYARLTPAIKKAAVTVAYDALSQEKERMASCSRMITELTEKEFCNANDTMNHNLYVLIDSSNAAKTGLSFDKIAEEEISKADLLSGTSENIAYIPLAEI